MKTFLKYTLLTLLWAGVAAYIVYAAMTAQKGRVARKVARVRIEVVDSTSRGYLVSSSRVREWISRSGITTIGTAVDAVDLVGLEQLIARNGFVDRVDAYVAYEGTLHIGISQRKPSLRLSIDGFDAYVTPEGYVFAVPLASSLYVPVVTGSYRPPFAASYTGSVRAYVDGRRREIDAVITQLEKEKYPVYKRERKNDEDLLKLRRMRVKRHWWRLERSAEFDKRVDELREHKVRQRRACRYRAQVIQQEIDAISARQQAERAKQKKLEKSYEDFMKLLTFVKQVEDDDFWRSEVVQIVARSTPSGALEVELVPRSGDHRILFGRIEQVDLKLEKLLRFYRSGLTSIGWDVYRIIDIRYKDQIVCKR